ncbi:MAG TPA: glycosyltransferase [Microvirga sp.]|nr:glycosyltransferase [Microvirga sp.]
MAADTPPERGARRPRLAVLIPVFNRQRGLERTLHSLRDDGASFDVIVVDDGSDPPLRVPDDLPFTVTLIRLARNRGIAAALNTGLERITAAGYEYIARLDAGDLSLPGRFAAQMAFLDWHPDHAVVGTQVKFMDPGGKLLFCSRAPTRHEEIIRSQRYKSCFAHPSVMMRTSALVKSGFYSERYPGSEDYELFMRLAKTYKLGNLDKVYLEYEVSPDSLSSRKFRHGLGRLLVLIRYFSPFSVHAYLGIFRNIIALFVPRQVSLGLRRAHAWWSSARRPALEDDPGRS